MIMPETESATEHEFFHIFCDMPGLMIGQLSALSGGKLDFKSKP